MRRRNLAGLGLLVLAGWAEAADISVVGTKLVIQDKLVSSGKAKVTFQSKDVNVTKGSGSDAAQLSARVVLRYNGASGEFVLPAGASDGTTGWTLNAAGVAKFINKLAPTGPTQAKTGQVKPGAAPRAGQLKLGAKGLGDVPVAIGAAPTESVYVAFEVTNGAEVNRHCAAFPVASCVWKALADGTGAQVACKGGVGDPACNATATTPSTTVTTSTSSTTTIPCDTPVGQWGSYGSDDGQFLADGIGVDGRGHVYIADNYNHRIQKFDANGVFLTKWGSLGTTNGRFDTPSDVAADGYGHVYVADRRNFRIQKFDANGTFLAKWGSLGSGPGQFGDVWGVAVGVSGNVYVVEPTRVQKFDENGTFLTQWGSGRLQFARGLGVDPRYEQVYVADQGASVILKFDADGTFLGEWGSPGSGQGQFDRVHDVAPDGRGNVYVADGDNYRIQKFTLAGGFLSMLDLRDPLGNIIPKGLATDGRNLFMTGPAFVKKYACPIVSGCFHDVGDGTIYDLCAHRQWEKKYASDGAADPADPNDVDSTLPFANFCMGTGTLCQPTIGAAALCAAFTGSAVACSPSCPTGCSSRTVFLWLHNLNTANHAGHNDWRLPSVGQLGDPAELESILLAPYPCPLYPFPCIDSIFGSTSAGYYWSSTDFGANAYGIEFSSSLVVNSSMTSHLYHRAVRALP